MRPAAERFLLVSTDQLGCYQAVADLEVGEHSTPSTCEAMRIWQHTKAKSLGFVGRYDQSEVCLPGFLNSLEGRQSQYPDSQANEAGIRKALVANSVTSSFRCIGANPTGILF
jgi:hypothetical protein